MKKIKKCPLCCNNNNLRQWTSVSNTFITSSECITCDIVFADQILGDDEYHSFYDLYNDTRDINTKELKEKRDACYLNDKFFIEQNCGKEFQNILDVGCGTGKFISLFNSNNKTGFDIDKSVITNNKLQYDEINFISDLNDLNENEEFDLIIFRGTFQYMRDLHAIKEFITKKLINGGHLVILSIPNKNSPLANIQREHWSLYNPIEMFNIFSISSLKRLFDDFETVDVEYPYLDTPYADEKQDMKKFLDLVKINKQEKFAFWGSMMQIIFRK